MERKKEFDLDEIDMKWEDEVFPEDKMLKTLLKSKIKPRK